VAIVVIKQLYLKEDVQTEHSPSKFRLCNNFFNILAQNVESEEDMEAIQVKLHFPAVLPTYCKFND
jgi:hypothetical protein